jgi:nitroreductase
MSLIPFPSTAVPSGLVELLRARYGNAGSVPEGGLPLPDEVLESLLAHRSVRAYRPDPLPPGALELIIAAAQSAPTSSNLQAWSVVSVEEPARKSRLAGLCRNQSHIHEAPLFLVWIADLSRLRRAAGRSGSPASGLGHLETFLVAVIDATLAAQNAVVAAESLGLGTVCIGAIRNESVKVAAELALPAEAFPLFGLVVGHPDPARPAAEVKPRLPQSEVLHRETYSTASEEQAIAQYDSVLGAFQASQGLPATGWTRQAIQRIADASALGSRAHLAKAIAALGFKLD